MKDLSFLFIILKQFLLDTLTVYSGFHKLTFMKKTIVILLSFLISLIFMFLLFRYVHIPMQYKEFIVGSSTWYNEGKIIDLIAGPIFIFIFILSFGFFSFFLKKNEFKINYYDFLRDYKYWLIPIIISPFISIYVLFLSCITLIYSFYHKSKQIESKYVSYSIIASFMFMLLPLSISSILKTHVINLNFVFLWLIAMFFVNIIGATFSYEKFKKYINKVFLFAQIPLPFLFFNIMPKHLITDNMGKISYNYSFSLSLIVILLVAIAIFDIFNRYYKTKNLDINNIKNLLKLLSPLTLFAILMICKFSLTALPSVSADDYHFGESLLGAWSYVQGIIPYINYIPAHGLFMDDFSSFLNLILFDGLAGSSNQAYIIASVITSLIVFLSISYCLKNIFLGFFITLLFPMLFNWAILIPFICIWLNDKIINKQALWVSVFMITFPLLVLMIPPQGSVLVASFSIIFAYYCYKILKKPCLTDFKLIIFPFVALLIFMIFTPFLSMFIHACMYVVENAFINQQSYGISIFLSWTNKSFLTIVFRELARNSWVFVVIASFLLTLINLKDKNKLDLFRLIILPLFIILMIPYGMGRIDPGVASRPFVLSSFSLIILLPIILKNSKKQFLLLFIILLYSLTFKLVPNVLINIKNLLDKNIYVGNLINGTEYGLNNLGLTRIDQDQLIRLEKINNMLNTYILKDEKYLDLTSRNAQYFYLNKLPPVSITAPYNMVSINQQVRAINDIDNKKINIALLYADNIIHDGGGLALRNPLLFRYTYMKYIVFEKDGIIYGLRKGNNVKSDLISKIQNENNLYLLDKAFSIKNLYKIPISWGNSYNTLKNRLVNEIIVDPSLIKFNDFKQENSIYKIKGNNPYFYINLKSYNINGLDHGILLIDIEFNGIKGDPNFRLKYYGDDKEKTNTENYIDFTANSGILIIPLDSQPRYLNLQKLQKIKIVLENHESIDSLKINSIKLYQRKILEENNLWKNMIK